MSPSMPSFTFYSRRTFTNDLPSWLRETKHGLPYAKPTHKHRAPYSDPTWTDENNNHPAVLIAGAEAFRRAGIKNPVG